MTQTPFSPNDFSRRFAGPLAALMLALGLAACSGEAAFGDAAPADEEATAEAEADKTADKEAAAAAAPRPAATAARQPAPEPVCQECGTVAAVEPVQLKGEGTGAGAISGAVAGGVVGNQFGGGSGKKVATAIGVIGGAIGGHAAEKKIRSKTIYSVTVRMDNGSTRVIEMEDASHLRVGQKVAVYGQDIALR